jgi:hypothetical protein
LVESKEHSPYADRNARHALLDGMAPKSDHFRAVTLRKCGK